MSIYQVPAFRAMQREVGVSTVEGGGGGRAPGPHAHGNAARQVVDGLTTEVCGRQKQSNDPHNNQHNPQCANYRAPLTRKRHIPPHSAQPQHTNDWAPQTRKRHRQEHRPQRPTERSDPTQHAKGRTGDCPGPRKGTTTRRNVTRGGGAQLTGPFISFYEFWRRRPRNAAHPKAKRWVRLANRLASPTPTPSPSAHRRWAI